jgi:formylglycine-generating enzyme required for sulfatase activity
MNSLLSVVAPSWSAIRVAAVLAILLPVACAPPPSQSQPDAAVGNPGPDAGEDPADTGSGDAATTCAANVPKSATVNVPAGNYIIGCNAAVDTECLSDELPMHTVTLSAFAIERTEVTQSQYATCLAAGSCTAPSCAWDCTLGDHPAGCITWAQAKAYCAWAGRRLPSEAEWESAARGPDGHKYPWGNQEADCALTNMAGCTGATDAVGQHPTGASPFGALDMAGNVVEMVEDWYDASYYQTSPTVNPTGPASGTQYGGRGGGYLSAEVWQRASDRDVYDLTDSYKSLGFRCAE